MGLAVVTLSKSPYPHCSSVPRDLASAGEGKRAKTSVPLAMPITWWGPGWTLGANTTPAVLSMSSCELLARLQEKKCQMRRLVSLCVAPRGSWSLRTRGRDHISGSLNLCLCVCVCGCVCVCVNIVLQLFLPCYYCCRGCLGVLLQSHVNSKSRPHDSNSLHNTDL